MHDLPIVLMARMLLLITGTCLLAGYSCKLQHRHTHTNTLFSCVGVAKEMICLAQQTSLTKLSIVNGHKSVPRVSQPLCVLLLELHLKCLDFGSECVFDSISVCDSTRSTLGETRVDHYREVIQSPEVL